MYEHLIGKRIKLVSTGDSYTKLKPGDLGTVVDVDTVNLPPRPSTHIWVKWDNGSRLALIQGEDSYEIIDYKN